MTLVSKFPAGTYKAIHKQLPHTRLLQGATFFAAIALRVFSSMFHTNLQQTVSQEMVGG